MKVAVIGGGAAGFFTAINIAEKCAGCEITIFEKSNSVLSKVKISGGGRCNVTNGRTSISELIDFYPRGNKKLYKLLKDFSTAEMRKWLLNRGVSTKIEPDLRVFPVSDSSSSIVDCFLNQCHKYNIEIKTKSSVDRIFPSENHWSVVIDGEPEVFDKVVWATGSSNKAWEILDNLNLERASGVPSLFTFTIKDPRLEELSGLSFPNVSVKIAGTKFEETGPLLITHWGLSGPAVLKLSSRAAMELNELSYNFKILVNFMGDHKVDEVHRIIKSKLEVNQKKKTKNLHFESVPNRYMERLTKMKSIDEKPIQELSQKDINRLTEELSQAQFQVNGKSTFKEEFVTCGGVLLSEVDLSSMEVKKFPGLYLAGEVLNIDALTGGFNFQACWSAGWAISENIKNKNDR